MQFLRILDTDVNDAYRNISTILNDSVKFCERDKLMLNIEISSYVDKEDLFLSIVADYEDVGYDVRIFDGKEKNQYSIKLSWENYISPETEYMQVMNYIHMHEIEYETLKVSKLRRMPSQLSSFPAYRSSESTLSYAYDYVVGFVNSFLKFVWIA